MALDLRKKGNYRKGDESGGSVTVSFDVGSGRRDSGGTTTDLTENVNFSMS
jgi:hypothetical protein